ncbi:MAG: DNA-cytosine methyltransferase (EC [uncultured Sulfurovum sp.]|uniref:Cytosine-specific methyltransferase n=1 Tax=uncultured Sulfurovum sp. TaxID=269237 RepID=A0A6S6SV30_9BACT|nr:MAG: DNA-cytosine methyltransferase (EC [uncultured Sulfurovum sp.]
MIEFYYNYFQKSYKSKILQLIIDIEKLLTIESIDVCIKYEIIYDEKYNLNLNEKQWNRLNQLHYTLVQKREVISSTLMKFINKKKVNKKFSFVDTFAGAGGLSLGMENVGFNPIFVNEVEPRFLETYYFNRELPLENYFCDDIKKLVKNHEQYSHHFQDIDLFVGGPPCQGFSMANRQPILDDPRNELYKYYLELLHLVQPKFFIMENVKGMMNKSDEIKNDFQQKVGENYSIEIILLNAKDFNIPQNRERVFVIGSKLKHIRASQIIKDILNDQTIEDSFKLKDALEGLPILMPKKIKNASKLENEEIGFKFRNYPIKETKYMKFLNNKKSNYLSNHINRYNNDRDIEIFSRLPQGANSLHESIEDIMPYKNRNHMFKDKYFKLNEADNSKTITSHMKYDCNMYIHPKESRGLSPREAARIQTFPDDYVFMGANNGWYAQIGNAVPVKLAEVIGKNIIKYLGDQHE